ncbi:MAG: plastocyanin/azurin family copper-binding protein [Acidimicrobiales bacterium]|nr:plastocyanin/azurin family copper-binding protein [Acidimicrobiales bacterium]
MSTRLFAIAVVLVLALTACGNDDDETEPAATDPPAGAEENGPDEAESTPSEGGAEVDATGGFQFEPATVEIEAGESVTWTNSGGVRHTVTSTSDSMDFDEPLGSDDSVTVTFDEPGTYDYECTIHPGMTGTVVVS